MIIIIGNVFDFHFSDQSPCVEDDRHPDKQLTNIEHPVDHQTFIRKVGILVFRAVEVVDVDNWQGDVHDEITKNEQNNEYSSIPENFKLNLLDLSYFPLMYYSYMVTPKNFGVYN